MMMIMMMMNAAGELFGVSSVPAAKPELYSDDDDDKDDEDDDHCRQVMTDSSTSTA